MIIAYVGIGYGQSKVTSNLIATAATLAVDHPMRILVTHSQTEYSNLQLAFSKLIGKWQAKDRNSGMAGLNRLIDCGNLDASSIRDNTDNILKDRLDLLYSRPTDHLSEEETLRSFTYLFENYRRDYDLFFVDINSGFNQKITERIIDKADLVVVNLSQNMNLMSHLEMTKKRLKDKNVVYCVGAFDARAKTTLSKIASDYELPKQKLGAIPYNVKYMDALNKQNVMDYILRIRGVKKKFLIHNENFTFISSTRGMNHIVLKSLGLRPLSEEEAYA